jgi:hypothetical protein
MRLDLSLKVPKERTLEERQSEMRSDFQAGRSVVEDMVVRVWRVCCLLIRWMVFVLRRVNGGFWSSMSDARKVWRGCKSVNREGGVLDDEHFTSMMSCLDLNRTCIGIDRSFPIYRCLECSPKRSRDAVTLETRCSLRLPRYVCVSSTEAIDSTVRVSLCERLWNSSTIACLRTMWIKPL